MKKALRYGVYEYKKRLIEPKIYVIMLFMLFFLNITISPLKGVAAVLGVSIPFGTSYIFMSEPYIYTVIGVAMVIFMFDVIKTDRDITDVRQRTDRKEDFLGRAVLVLFKSITFILIYVLENLLLTIKFICFHNDWETLGYTLSKTDIAKNAEGLIQFPYYIINEYTIWETVIYEIVIMFLLCLFSGFVMLSLKKVLNGFLGIAILFILVFFANTMEDSFNMDLLKLSPFSWLSLSNMTKGGEPFLPELQYVFMALFFLVVVSCIIGGIINMYDFTDIRHIIRKDRKGKDNGRYNKNRKCV